MRLRLALVCIAAVALTAPAMHEIYTTFFTAGRFPARIAAGASGLALDARVEIECIAAESSS